MKFKELNEMKFLDIQQYENIILDIINNKKNFAVSIGAEGDSELESIKNLTFSEAIKQGVEAQKYHAKEYNKHWDGDVSSCILTQTSWDPIVVYDGKKWSIVEL